MRVKAALVVKAATVAKFEPVAMSVPVAEFVVTAEPVAMAVPVAIAEPVVPAVPAVMAAMVLVTERKPCSPDIATRLPDLKRRSEQNDGAYVSSENGLCCGLAYQ